MSLLTTDFGSPLAEVSTPSAERVRGERMLCGVEGRHYVCSPRSFKGIKGTPSNVRFGGTPRATRGHTAAQRLGLAYEQRVVDVLSAIYGDNFRSAPSILYEDRTGTRMAIPDGILRIGATLVVIEVKLTHCEKAWWQLNSLYVPLLSRLTIPGTPIVAVEVCRSYDPQITFPAPSAVISSLHKIPPAVTGILPWKL